MNRKARRRQRKLAEKLRKEAPPPQTLPPTPLPASNTLEVAIQGGVKVVTPNDIRLTTPYILLEQEDWFEAEIRFVRHLARPGMKMLDIGANYGVYTLTMSRGVGPSGAVCAVEPTPETAAYLQKSMRLNRLQNVRLVRSALSNRSGEATFYCSPQSELNTLRQRPYSTPQKVHLLTLDQCLAMNGWRQLDFIKLDAEGEESHIIEGGTKSLKSHQPLIQMEMRHGGRFNLEPVRQLESLGFQPYRLIPGLNLLAPCQPSAEMENPPLNLFFSTLMRASQLEEQGYLSTQMQPPCPTLPHDAVSWPETLWERPFAASLKGHWQAPDGEGAQDVARALQRHAIAQEEGRPPSERLAALQAAMTDLQRAISVQATIPRLSSLARIALELSERRLGLATLTRMQTLLQQSGGDDPLAEPFLPITARFEGLSPEEDRISWLLVGLLETMVRYNAYSSYYSGAHDEGVLEALVQKPFHSAEMERRLQLIRMRLGKQKGPQALGMPGSLNGGYWENTIC